MRWLLLCLLLVGSGCFRTTIYNREPAAQPAGVGVKVKHSFIHGLIELGTVELDNACPGGGRWLGIHEQMTALNSLLTLVSVGLYTPRAVQVQCAERE